MQKKRPRQQGTGLWESLHRRSLFADEIYQLASCSTAIANGMRSVKEDSDPKNTISCAYAITRSDWIAMKEQGE